MQHLTAAESGLFKSSDTEDLFVVFSPSGSPDASMKVACLQFAPELGKVEQNMDKANRIVEKSLSELRPPSEGRPVWLVLPEMAFSGYNFESLEEITPFLEPTCSGPSTQWAINIARRLGIFVTVGYPETSPATSPSSDSEEGNSPKSAPKKPQANYNSTVTVNPSGTVIANYRKRFLYYTDETWALEGDGKTSESGFFNGDLGPLGQVAMGICMDISNYKFLAPWDAFEFANHVISSRCPLVVLSMAWLTRLGEYELAELPLRPDDETFVFWMERLSLLRDSEDTKRIVVIANRCGREGSACYAGTSTVVALGRGKVEIFDVCGKFEEKCMVVDLASKPRFELQRGQS